jgi:hypothetical protein
MEARTTNVARVSARFSKSLASRRLPVAPEPRRLSRQLIYSAEYGAMNNLLAYLTENCCGRDGARVPACDAAAILATGDR